MTALVHHMQHIFRAYHVPYNALTDKLATISYDSQWCNSDIWFSHCTELDSTTLYYLRKLETSKFDKRVNEQVKV